MMQDTFKRIVAEQNGKFGQADKTIKGRYLSSAPMTTYQMTIPHGEKMIFVQNEFGHQNIGNIWCELSPKAGFEFETNERGIFSKIFDRQSNYLIINTKNQVLKTFIESHETFKVLNQLAKDDLFEPVITGKHKDNIYKIETRYHLAFRSREQVIEPIINFHKTLIDFLNK